MILNRSNWNKSDYQKFVDYLFSFEDLEYKNFNSKLVLKNNLIGIRVPILKKIAKELDFVISYNECEMTDFTDKFESQIRIIAKYRIDFERICLFLLS